MYRLELLFIFFISGIYIANVLFIPVTISCGMMIITTGLILYYEYKQINLLAVLLYIFLLAAGMMRIEQANIVLPNDIMHYEDCEGWIKGTIISEPMIYPYDDKSGLVRYTIQVESISLDGKEQKVTGGAVFTLKSMHGQELCVPDDKVKLFGKVEKPRNFNNPGAFDYVSMLKRQDISVRIVGVKAESLSITARYSPFYKIAFRNWNKRVMSFMNQVLPNEDAALLRGMLFGGYTGIDKEVTRVFSTTGIIHILSVSGAHVALLSAVILWIGRTCKIKRFAIMVTAGLCIVVYGMVCGLTAPVVRSIIMGLITLFGTLLGRETDAKRALIVSGFLMLFFEPRLLDDISFQLSFFSTAGLLYLSSKFTCIFEMFVPKLMAQAFSVTLSAQLGIIPFVARYFSSLSLSAFFANLIIVPILETIVILGLAAVFFITVFLEMPGRVLLVVCGLMLKIAVYLTELLAGIPAAEIYIFPMGIVLGCLYYLFLYFICGDFKNKIIKELGFAVCSCFVVGFIIFRSIIPGSLEVHFIDVGQGDATLFITPNRKAILIDTGGSTNEAFDIGERVVVPYLNYCGITSLDYLILTHSHQDHAGGSAAIAMKKKIKHIILPKNDRGYPVKKLLKQVGATAEVLNAVSGQAFFIDGVKFEILYSGNEELFMDGNEFSLVIRAEYKKSSFLITGDLCAEGEIDMLNRLSCIKKVSVLKIGHHGSKTASSEDFLTALKPEFAVISAGHNNRFGHPHQEILMRLLKRKIKTLRTDLSGAITFYTDGENLVPVTFIK